MNIEKLLAWAKEFADQMETNANVSTLVAPRLRLMATWLASGHKKAGEFAQADIQRKAQEAELRAMMMADDIGLRITVSPTKRFIVTFCRIDSGFVVGTAVAQELDEALRLAMADKNRGRGQL